MSDNEVHLLDPAPFGRIIPAMVTPMKSDGSIDYDAAARVAKALVADGADGILVNGTTGESPVTHMQEKVDLVRAVKEVVDVPVISGAGSNDTIHSVRMAEFTSQAGADGVLVVTPYYSRPSQQGIVEHFRAINDAVDKPIMIYDIPARTGVHLQVSTYVQLAQLEHVTSVKDATGDIAGAVRKRIETGLDWYCGDDGLFLPFLSVGAVGIISVIAHAASGALSRLAAAFDAGHIHQAQALTVQLSPVVEAFNGSGQQSVMAKASMVARGLLDDASMRLPNIGPSSSDIERMRQLLLEYGDLLHMA